MLYNYLETEHASEESEKEGHASNPIQHERATTQPLDQEHLYTQAGGEGREGRREEGGEGRGESHGERCICCI